jgi:ribosomal protein L32
MVFDCRVLSEDGSTGEFLLAGRACWNCGVAYERLFAPGGYKPATP